MKEHVYESNFEFEISEWKYMTAASLYGTLNCDPAPAKSTHTIYQTFCTSLPTGNHGRSHASSLGKWVEYTSLLQVPLTNKPIKYSIPSKNGSKKHGLAKRMERLNHIVDLYNLFKVHLGPGHDFVAALALCYNLSVARLHCRDCWMMWNTSSVAARDQHSILMGPAPRPEDWSRKVVPCLQTVESVDAVHQPWARIGLMCRKLGFGCMCPMHPNINLSVSEPGCQRKTKN